VKRKKEKRLMEATEKAAKSVNQSQQATIDIDLDLVSIDSAQEKHPPVYVYPCFLKPGRQTFLVGDERGNFYVHKFVAP
jgi:hypothetical protein